MKERALFQELREEGREENRLELEREKKRAEKAEAELKELKEKYELLLAEKKLG